VFTFRSAVVGDLAPIANARAPLPRVKEPPAGRVVVAQAPAPVADADAFGDGRLLGRKPRADVDEALDALAALGSEARILESDATRKRIRLYRCASCASGEGVHGCERERGYLAGAFEALSGQLAKVDEVACASRGEPYCEFEVRHALVLRVVP
ncbi:MAG TPA: 4-vinyl reductase, partial [Candidatus Thermoplasmatota archaeon]|nr:4-vinyl reductase [Candidatus Thermoplasmatota archaeon]